MSAAPLFSTDVPLKAIAATAANSRITADISKQIRKVINNLRFNMLSQRRFTCVAMIAGCACIETAAYSEQLSPGVPTN
jgi:hypothetical protein